MKNIDQQQKRLFDLVDLEKALIRFRNEQGSTDVLDDALDETSCKREEQEAQLRVLRFQQSRKSIKKRVIG